MLPKQSSVQVHPSRAELNELMNKIEAISDQHVLPAAERLLSTPGSNATCRARAKVNQLREAQQKLQEACAILQRF
jgi:hypothetical protein